ncbi:MAG: aldo/keto reductase [Ruminococcaceae bacterium]|nr:aldo/keto reductase [Oscillospiraceae bacterium]
MKYRKFGKLGIEVSAFGVGFMRFPMKKNEEGVNVVDETISTPTLRYAIDHGVNYVDTAYVYSDKKNESALAHALRDGYREKVYLATKLPTWMTNSREDMDKYLDEQLANLETDHIDFYLIHSLRGETWDKLYSLGVTDFLDKAKASGKIKYACFSFHDDYDAFVRILDAYDWDMCQIQFNYMDVNNQATIKGLEYAGSKGIPVVIMEGLLGGKLAVAPDNVQKLYDEFPVKRSPVEWAFRWICDHPEVGTVLSGVTSMEQCMDNIEIFSRCDIGIMTDEEKKLIDNVRDAYNSRTKVGCTKCGYCMPCPNGVDIPGTFEIWNKLFLYDSKLSGNERYAKYIKEEKDASRCIECGACEGVCPQKIQIIDMLKKADSEMR